MTFDREGPSHSFDRSHASSSSSGAADTRTRAELAEGYTTRLPEHIRSLEKTLAAVRAAEHSRDGRRSQVAREELAQSVRVARFMRDKAAQLAGHASAPVQAALYDLLGQINELVQTAKLYLSQEDAPASSQGEVNVLATPTRTRSPNASTTSASASREPAGNPIHREAEILAILTRPISGPIEPAYQQLEAALAG